MSGRYYAASPCGMRVGPDLEWATYDECVDWIADEWGEGAVNASVIVSSDCLVVLGEVGDPDECPCDDCMAGVPV